MKIAYWSTACLEPRHEAVSQEVLKLAAEFAGSWVFSTSRHIWARASLRDRYFGLHSGLNIALRLGIPLLERAFDVNHIYGDLTPWIFHKSLRTKPIVHTVTQDSDNPLQPLLERCNSLVAQTDATRDRLISLGVPRARLHLRYPGVDLSHFRPVNSTVHTNAGVRVLFATSPRTIEEMQGRGVHLLLDAAKRCPTVTFRLLYRNWSTGYTSLEPTRAAILERELTNVDLIDSVVTDMRPEYHSTHVTLIPFTKRSGGKECPNSALESLASGIPVLVSRECPFSRFVIEHDCGVVFDPTPEALESAISEAMLRWSALAVAARKAAETHFDTRQLPAFYKRLYEAAVAKKSIPGEALSRA